MRRSSADVFYEKPFADALGKKLAHRDATTSRRLPTGRRGNTSGVDGREKESITKEATARHHLSIRDR